MKYKSRVWMLMLPMAVGLLGCFEEPTYSETPSISFEGLRFVDTEVGGDSLVLSFGFTDGDGDIGLDESETFYPFHSTNYILDSRSVFQEDDGFVFVLEDGIKYLEFGDTAIVPPVYEVAIFSPQLRRRVRADELYHGVIFNTLEEDEYVMPPFECDTYLLVPDSVQGALSSDTIHIKPNDFKSNIVLDFYRKRGGQYELITDLFSRTPCTEPFDARIPIFEVDNIGRPLVGTINYALISSGFEINFLNDSIMIEFYVYDRRLNKSNVTRSNDFLLRDLQ